MAHPALDPHLNPQVEASLQAELTAALENVALWAGLPGDVCPQLLPRFARYYECLTHLPRRMRRRLQRQWRRSLGAIALLLALGQAPVLAATLNVTTTDPNISDGDTFCSLIEAIHNANDNTTGSVHTDCTAGTPNGADIINLPAASTHTLTVANYGDTGLPEVSSTITIEGNNSTIRRDPADPDQFRIFAVIGTGNLTLKETTVSGGAATNVGGGIANHGALTLSDSTVSANSAARGGGVHNFYGTATLTHSTVSGNSALRGGGVYNGVSSTLTLTNSTVSGNSARFGGGIANYDGVLTLSDSTVSANSAVYYGGGVACTAATLSRTLVSGNTAPEGAEVYSYGVPITVANYNLLGHDGLSNAQAFDGFTPSGSDITATSDGTTPTALASILGPLASNGGPTQTHALAVASPAIDAVTDGSCPPPEFDQRGVARPQDGDGDTIAECDIGSVEVDELLCNGLVPTIVGTPGNDANLRGTNGPDVIHGLGGNDIISGLNANDVICGGEGKDILSGNNGIDQLFGENGDDILNGNNGADALDGGTGSDVCNGGNGSDTGVNCEPFNQ